MVQKDSLANPDAKSSMGYFDGTNSASLHPPSAPPAIYMQPSRELPPAYSESDPNGPADAPPPFEAAELADLKVDKKSSSELTATKGFAFDHPLYLHTTGVSSSSIVIEPDTNMNNQGAIVVTAELSSLSSGIEEKSEFTVHLNSSNEYDFHVNVAWSIWNMMSISCRFIVRVPSTISCAHPGIRAEITKGRIDISSLPNVEFSHIHLKTTNSSTSMSYVRGGDIRFTTSNGEMKFNNVVATRKLDAQTSNAKITLENAKTPALTASTSNGGISLERIEGGSVRAQTSNSSISCNQTKAIDLELKTRNSSINTADVEADNMHISTENARVEGVWKVKSGLYIHTSNSRIDGTIELIDPMAPATIRLETTNSKIKAHLPAEAFRGTVDARTSNSKASVEWLNSHVQQPEITYIVDDKSYKRAKIGAARELRHDFAAKTSNSGIDISLA
ncbi:hypothetical protein GGI12_002978 [Dipsacomyces acuminosporus]|nr:hypothetical protein GGI12_002978 [Dipsacomyces acuminosporus]